MFEPCRPKNVVMVGRGYVGKTTKACHLARQLHPHIIAFDPGRTIQPWMVKAERRVTNDIDMYDDMVQGRGVLCSQPMGEDPLEAWQWISYTASYAANYSFLIDESSHLQKANLIDKRLDAVIREGRFRCVASIQTVHRIKSINMKSRANLTDIYWFPCVNPDDRDDLAEWIGKENAKKAEDLKEFEYLHIDLVTTELTVDRDSEKWQLVK